ncbi:hypothetical protein B0H34DRAFT_334994 [Crassisporium funariophilum]|nr:hypothetical protein B0H34DRAFT_334994 [Crassisporium funariophilum]
MGRLRRDLKPPASGAIIFYGSTSLNSASKAKTSLAQESDLALNAEVDALPDKAAAVPKQTSSTSPTLIASTSTSTIASAAEKRGSASSHNILRLIRDISALFDNVPYVKVVAGVVAQIIAICDVRCVHCILMYPYRFPCHSQPIGDSSQQG